MALTQATNGTDASFVNTPLFEQVEAWIAARIAAGDIKGKLPTENELARSLKVSCGTMRKALGALSARGVITRVQGHGTFVRDRVDLATLPEPARALIELLGKLPEATRNEIALAIQARLHELANRPPPTDLTQAELAKHDADLASMLEAGAA